jgi:hypothetical protein
MDGLNHLQRPLELNVFKKMGEKSEIAVPVIMCSIFNSLFVFLGQAIDAELELKLGKQLGESKTKVPSFTPLNRSGSRCDETVLVLICVLYLLGI